jgi:putative nucleotidyltransferase with HDIG domain
MLIARGRQHVAKKPFAVFLIFMALWGLFIFLMRSTPDMEQALFWENFVFIFILSAANSFYCFTTAFTSGTLAKKTFYPLLGISIIMVGLTPTDLVFQGMQLNWYGKAPVLGPLFPLYLFCVYVPLLLSLISILNKFYKSRNNDEKIRNQYILIGLIAMFIGGTTDYLPVLGVQMYPLGIIGNIMFCVMATIAMLKYGLMEMRVVLRKGVAYSLISICIFGIFGSIIVLATTIFNDLTRPLPLTIAITAVFLVAAIFQPLMLRLQRIVDRWFFRQRYDYIQALKRFAQDIEGDLDLDQVATLLVTTVANSMQSRGVYLLLPSPDNKEFITYAFSGQKNMAENISFSTSSPLAATIKYQEKIIDINDMDNLPVSSILTKNDRKVLLDNSIEILMPLRKDNHLIGLLLLSRKISRENYSNEDKQYLQSVSNDVAARIDNASRYHTIFKAHQDLQKTMEGIITVVSAVVESRDPYTAGHQRRVAELARAIAREMGLSEWQVQGVHIIGLLHDVGKIAVPAEILSKPGKINQYEFNIIQNHSKTGFEILEKVDFPWPVAKAILQHHERLNGSGYPQGLSGNEIILEARILGIADVVEAMSSHRPYRPSLGIHLALKEIKSNSGILYEPEIVEACLRLLQKGDIAFENLMSAAENPTIEISGNYLSSPKFN